MVRVFLNFNLLLFIKVLPAPSDSQRNLSPVSLLATILPDGTKEEKKALRHQLRTCMTEIQYRRFCLFYADGLSIQEIARWKRASRPAISKSLTAAWKKIWKLFVNNL